jgi:hypothetical protein
MLKTNFIITCDQAFLTAGSNNLNLIGIFSQINAELFPVKYPRFALVANFDVEKLGDHTLETKIIDPNGAQIGQVRMNVNISSSPFQVIANFENLTFGIPGRYELHVLLDGTPVGTRTLELRLQLKQKTHFA